MSNGLNFKINSYDALISAKKILKSDIEEQENSFINNPVFKISSSLFSGDSFKNSFQKSFDSLSLSDMIKTGENLLSTVLMSNKKTRKFFIAFIVAKEMVPFLFMKINEMFSHNEPVKE
jgi:hypothetical protein